MGFTSEFHGKPLRFLKRADRVFQKEIESFLQRTDLPEFTFQFVKPSSETTIKKNVAFWWERPSVFRAYQLILNDTWVASLVNSRDTTQVFSARIPLLRQEVKKRGPIVLECLLDETDRILWVVDILHSKGVNTQKTMNFLERYKLANEIVQTCIQPHAVLQSCEVKMAPWREIQDLESWEPTPKCCLEMMCLEAGWRRFVWKNEDQKPSVVVKQEFTENRKAKEVVKIEECLIIDEEEHPIHQTSFPPLPTKPLPSPKLVANTPILTATPTPTPTNHKVGFLLKDPKANGPDLYILQSADGAPLGSAAIRSMPLRLLLRKEITSTDTKHCLVHISWYEPFHKYEVTGLVTKDNSE